APNAVLTTEEDLRHYGFGPERQFEALLAFLDGEPAGLALFHPRFSTWLGRPGVYLEDLFVTQAARGKGVGRRLMTRLAAVAVERGWERIDFQVLDWNPARGFYRRLGIEHLGEWLRYGGDAAALRRLAPRIYPTGIDPGRSVRGAHQDFLAMQLPESRFDGVLQTPRCSMCPARNYRGFCW